MRYLLPMLFLTFCCCQLTAQTTLQDWNSSRYQHTERSMWVLGGWAAANIAVGAVGMSRSRGEQRAFHQMNLAWGAVNLGLAATGLWSATHGDVTMDGWASYEALQQTQRIFLFNAGLDVGYVMTGVWLKERSKNVSKNPDRLHGFGRSLLLQGAFLFVFDLGAFLYHQPLGKQFREMTPMGNIRLGLHSDGAGLVWTF